MTMPLPLSLDTAAAGQLRLDLKAMVERREPLNLDGSGVELVGQACLQVLSAAQIAATSAGLAFVVDGPSTTLTEMARLARLDVLLPAQGR